MLQQIIYVKLKQMDLIFDLKFNKMNMRGLWFGWQFTIMVNHNAIKIKQYIHSYSKNIRLKLLQPVSL